MDTANILVVEDDADINRLLCTILEGAGYTCRAAFSGSEALLWAEKYDYDLIVLDRCDRGGAHHPHPSGQNHAHHRGLGQSGDIRPGECA